MIKISRSTRAGKATAMENGLKELCTNNGQDKNTQLNV
jgi:hypothetical protein